MSVYLVTWDLNKEGEAYRSASSALHSALDNLKDTKKESGLDSVRFVSTVWNSKQILNYLHPEFIDDNDTLFIVKIHSGEYSSYITSTVGDWIKERL